MPKSDDSAVDPEGAVRLYLMFLQDPESLVDAQSIKKLEAELERAQDPIDRLRAYTAVQRAKVSDDTTYKYDFIKYAKRWADSEGIPVEAFRHAGVEDDVLKAAGIIPTGKRGRGRAISEPSGSRRSRTSPEHLEEGILALDGPFSVRDIIDSVGSSTVTVKAALDRLEATGKIKPAGERSSRRGRAAKVWEVVAA